MTKFLFGGSKFSFIHTVFRQHSVEKYIKTRSRLTSTLPCYKNKFREISLFSSWSLTKFYFKHNRFSWINLFAKEWQRTCTYCKFNSRDLYEKVIHTSLHLLFQVLMPSFISRWIYLLSYRLLPVNFYPQNKGTATLSPEK